MATAIEAASYRLGIRLTQCREIHRRAFGGRPAGPSPSSVGPDDVVLAKRAIRELEIAFQEFCQLANPCDGVPQAGMALIRNCQRLWKSWSQTPTVQLHNEMEPMDDMEFTDTLQALDDRIVQIAEDTAPPVDRRNTWFLLGEQIADGGWETPSDRAWVVSVLKRQPKKTPVIHRYEDGMWTWTDSEEVRELMRAVAAKRADLLPNIEDNAASRRLLPYDRIDYWPWFKIEAGLRTLLNAVPLSPTETSGSETLVPSTPAQESRGASPAQLRAGYLGLVFSDERFTLSRRGYAEILDFSTSRLGWAILKTLEKNGDSWLSRDRIKAIWEDAGVARRPADGTVNDRISELSRNLSALGLKIKSSRQIGVRLELLD